MVQSQRPFNLEASFAPKLQILWRPTRILLDPGMVNTEGPIFNSLVIPGYVALVSAIVLLVQVLFHAPSTKTRLQPLEEAREDEGRVSDVEDDAQDTGFSYKIIRLIGCIALLGCSIYPSSANNGIRLVLSAIYLYASLLSLISMNSGATWGRTIAHHLNIVLITLFFIYTYRNIYPLATTTLVPQDISEGWILWVKIGLLTISGLVVPLLKPRKYIPVSLKDPMVPNPEQTASIWSLITYSFMDPVVFLAYRVPHLSPDKLPPLADYDHAKNLREKTFSRINTDNKRHIFFKLLRIFQREYILMTFLLIIQAISSFASPLGIKRLLHYIETGGRDSAVRPWFWVVWLFVGPSVRSFALQWYTFMASRTITRIEAIITQLVFEHSLRMRLKAETSNTSGESSPSNISKASSVASTDDTATSDVASDIAPSSDGSTLASEPTKSREGSADLVGKINSLVTTDMANIRGARDFLSILIYIPLHIALATWFLYVTLGWSAFVGLAVIIGLFPLPSYIVSRIQGVEITRMKKTDARVQTVSEAMNVLRMVKLFGWENKMNKKIEEKRDEELVWMWRRQVLNLSKGLINFAIPVVTMMATYATYVCVPYLNTITLIMRQDLNASKVFSSMAVFDILRGQLHLVFHTVAQIVTGKVSIDRVNDFINNTELLDTFSGPMDEATVRVPDDTTIGFRDATFTWSQDVDLKTPSRRTYVLRIADELTFKRGCINLIIGPTGSGKTSILMALLGEMHFRPSGPNSWYNLPREHGVAYAAQESWVLNQTIKDNILFGSPFDKERYEKVIHQCCLEHDLSLLGAGDQTEVGEKGLTLSGGQKARVTLARAIYSQAEILLLDDVFAALDVHTAKWILDRCFSGDLVKGRTVLLITHNLAMTLPVATFVVSVGLDGQLSQGSTSETLNNDLLADKALDVLDAEHDIKIHHPLSPTDEPKVDGKLIVAEEVGAGNVSWGALRLYLSGLGGDYPTLFFLTFASGMILSEFAFTGQTWYLGRWAAQYDLPGADVDVLHYLGFYGCLLLSAVALFFCACVVYIFGTLRASRTIHKQLVTSVLGTTLRWLDVTPTSRVITRCTQDIGAVDGPIANMIQWLSELTVAMIVKLGAIVILTPVFLGPGIAVALFGSWCCRVYMAAQLSVKREMSNVKAPIIGHFGTTISGLVSIRAYGAQSSFIKESLLRVDCHTRVARTFYNLNRWVTIRMDAIGGAFTASLAGYLVYSQSQTPSNTGFSLNMAVDFSMMILVWVQLLNELEVQGNSLERIQGYLEIEQEAKPTESGIPPAYWPASGELRVENLSASYSPGGDKVLNDISFSVQSGERIGIVGRTGSGKSSLTLSLLRSIFTQGSVYYDGIPIQSLNLDVLRSKITIIPQIPEMLSGTLRQNLDPFDQFDDATLNDALRAAGLTSLQSEVDDNRITLDTAISSSGGNLSVGQRQILALARAIVRGSKLLILDEATSAIDHKTDSIIQTSLRHELGRDVTLIIAAHRLQSVMDADKIMVLDAGRIVEYDSPKGLLNLDGSRFRALVEEAGDKDMLYAIANSA